MNNGNETLLTLAANLNRLTDLEKRYRTLIENLNDGFVRVNNGLQILQLNSAFATMLGYEYDDLMGKNLLDFTAYHCDQVALLMGIGRRKGNQKDSYDLNFMSKDGRIVPTNINPTPYLDDENNVIGSFAVVKDLTEIKRTENTLKYQAHLLAHVSEGIIVTDVQGKIEYWNPSAENILGFDPCFTLHQNVFALFPLDKNSYINLFHDKSKEYTGLQKEMEYITPFGIQKYIRLSTAFLRNNYHKITGTVTVFSDLTELIRSRQQAEQANRAKTNFLATVSHDIRTPMIGIIGASDLLGQENLNNYQKDLVMTVQQSGQQLLELINDILDLSRIEAGYTLGVIKQFKLPQLIAECIETVYSKIEGNDLDILIEIDPIIPPLLVGDALQIRRVILNLLSNAIKFTNLGYIKISATSLAIDNLKENEVCLLFSVEDTGSGIPNEELNSIFEPFHQVKNHHSTGTGLGLTICKELVEKMGGQIWANSEVGKGSRFSFYLPLQKALLEPIKEPSTSFTSSKYNSLEAKSILIVEDNEINSKILSYMLKNAGYITTSVNNGRECLDILEKHTFDLILMDMQMPILNGYETTKLIRSNIKYSYIPIVALTAFAMDGDAQRCIKAGCDYYLPKPVTSASLYQALEQLLYNDKDTSAVNNKSPQNLIDSLMPEFISSTKKLIEKLQKATESRDYEWAMNITHDLKGMCGMYGFLNLSEAAAIANRYAKEQDSANLQNAFHNLKETFSSELIKASIN